MLARARTAGGASGDERAADAVGKRGADARVLPRHRVRCVRHPVLLSGSRLARRRLRVPEAVAFTESDSIFSSSHAGKRFYDDLKIRYVFGSRTRNAARGTRPSFTAMT